MENNQTKKNPITKKNITRKCPKGNWFVPSHGKCFPIEEAKRLKKLDQEMLKQKKKQEKKTGKPETQNEPQLDLDTTIDQDPIEEEIERPSSIMDPNPEGLENPQDSFEPEPEEVVEEEKEVETKTEPDSEEKEAGSEVIEEEPEPDETIDDDDTEDEDEFENENENTKLFQKEKKEYEKNNSKDHSESIEDRILYPSLNDSNFNKHIASKQEFHDHQFQGEIQKDIEAESKKACESEFEIMPHQKFVKNFMSLETPYNSLLLYHELGTGKTCSAIGITEEMREYMKQTGVLKKIMIIASPNVQDNFRKQLFDASKLKQMKNGSWNLETCVGNRLVKEINPTNIKDLPRERVIKTIRALIKKYYRFMGYDSVALYSDSEIKHLQRKEDRKNRRDGKRGQHSFLEHIENDLPEILDLEPIRSSDDEVTIEQKKKVIAKIKEKFDYRLIVVDEFHNMIARKENTKKSAAKILLQIVRYCKYTRLILLSATPMYNSQEEIVWITNILNLNDKRSTISERQVFDKNGDFVEEKKNADGLVVQESGEDLLRRKLTGYVSYVRGENPYTFPYRIYPNDFAESENIMKTYTYPKKQLNGNDISIQPKKYVLDNVFINKLETYQKQVYQTILKKLGDEIPNFKEKDTFGFQELGTPLSILNMTYPQEAFSAYVEANDFSTPFQGSTRELHGKEGLYNIMSYERIAQPYEQITNFVYKPDILKKHGRIFHLENIGKYSTKIESICKSILDSTGIVLIYSRYLEGGLLPMALALEEMGFSRYSYSSHVRPFLKEKQSYLNPLNMQKKTAQDSFTAKYAMITGTKLFSQNNELDLELIMNPSNSDGRFVKVVMISEAGSEGLDFKCIRQVHILEPWYNMSRIEQIIGRAVRNRSHCRLPFEQRNVELYMHGTYDDAEKETADMYLYRLSEYKAIQIGKITRIMKESAVDCLLNTQQNNFTVENINTEMELTLSSNSKKIKFRIGDKALSSKCDYMSQCELTCKPEKKGGITTIDRTTYTVRHIRESMDQISGRIRQLYRERPTYRIQELTQEIQARHTYSLEEIYYTLAHFLKNKLEWLVYKNTIGHLVKRDDLYIFQPNNISDMDASIFERTTPKYQKTRDIVIDLEKMPKVLSPFSEKNPEKEKDLGKNPKTKNENEIPEEKYLGKKHGIDLTSSKKNPQEFGFLEKKHTSFEKPSALGKMMENPSSSPSKKMNEYISQLYKTVEFWNQDLPTYLTIKTNEKATKSREHTHMGIRVVRIMKDFHKIPEKDILFHYIRHLLDVSKFTEKLNLVKGLFREESDFSKPILKEFTDIESVLQSYFREKMYAHSKKSHYVLCLTKTNENVLWVWSKGKWREAMITEKEDTDTLDWLEKTFQKRGKLLEKVRKEYKNVSEKETLGESMIGFIGINKSSSEDSGYIFKLKNVLQIRNALGASCDQASREATLSRLEKVKKVFGKEDDTYRVEGDNIYIEIDKSVLRITKHHVCLIYELFLRMMKDVWFLSPEEGVQSDITHLAIQSSKADKKYVFDFAQKK